MASEDMRAAIDCIPGGPMTDLLPDQPRLGWIGTGRMGYPMVSRLLEAGHDVAVWNRTRAKGEPPAEAGAAIADTIAELADRDVVFTMVSTSADFTEVLLGDAGLLRQGAAPRIIVDSSTVDAEVSAEARTEAAKLGTDLVAAPVSGNGKVARSGKLSIVASGPAEAYQAVLPYLRTIGRDVTYAGEGEVARLVKLCHNVFLGVVTQALAEVTVLAE